MSNFGRMAHLLAAFMALLFLASCSAVQQGADILAGTGQISERDRQSIAKTSQAVSATFSQITEEQEYYIGRSVAALILAHAPAGLENHGEDKRINQEHQ